MNDFSKLIKSRTSKRAFLNKTIPKKTIIDILEDAKYTPSGGNTQPWIVYSISGNTLQNLSNNLLEALSASKENSPDLQYYPLTWKNPYKKRRIITGKSMYKSLNIDRKDTDSRTKIWHDNYKAFGSDNLLLVFLDESMVATSFGSILDSGAFMQSILLSIHSRSLGACPQGAIAEYSDIVKESLELTDTSLKLLYSVSLGYINEEEKINDFSPSRLKVEEFTTFLN